LASILLRIPEEAQPALPQGAPGVTFERVRFTMPDTTAAPRVSAPDVLESLRAAVTGVFPGPAIEALIARLEAGK
jgi:hypothetical protein